MVHCIGTALTQTARLRRAPPCLPPPTIPAGCYSPHAGFFDEADVGGQNLVGFHVNLGANQQPEWVSFSQAFRLFHAPDVVRATLAGNDAPQTAALAAIGDLHDRLVHEPVIGIASACATAGSQCNPVALTSTASITLPDSVTALDLTAKVEDHGLGVGATDIFVNGRNIGRQAAPTLTNGSAQTQLTVPLDPGANEVILRQYDGGNAILCGIPAAADHPGGRAANRAAGFWHALCAGYRH